MDDRVSVVVITRDRRDELLRTLPKLLDLPQAPAVIVVDNASSDGTADSVRAAYPGVDVIALEANEGAAGRNVGVERASTSYVAFSDDDSWWDADALTVAADILDAHADVAVVAGRIVIEPTGVDDPTCLTMAGSPLGHRDRLPGPSVLGFVACGAVVRPAAFLSVEGFPSGYGVGGEEAPVALALAAAGWQLVYVDQVVAHHAPSPSRDRASRRRREVRNDVWTAWLRLSGRAALRTTVEAGRQACDPFVRGGVLDALRGLPAMWAQRRVVPPAVECDWRTVRSGQVVATVSR